MFYGTIVTRSQKRVSTYSLDSVDVTPVLNLRVLA